MCERRRKAGDRRRTAVWATEHDLAICLRKHDHRTRVASPACRPSLAETCGSRCLHKLNLGKFQSNACRIGFSLPKPGDLSSTRQLNIAQQRLASNTKLRSTVIDCLTTSKRYCNVLSRLN